MPVSKIAKKILIGIGNPIFVFFKAFFTINLNWFYVFLTISMFFLALSSIWFYHQFLSDLPNINQIYIPPKMSTKIVDRHGQLLYKFYQDENRSWVPLDKIPQSLIWATIAIEDKDFYSHHGLSLRGIINALRYNFLKQQSDKPRGGSTITQQLVKNVFLTQEKTWRRKVREAVLTLLVEMKFSKNEILERYFNQVPYGGEVYGVQEASLKYFGKNAWEINTAEATFLAGLPAAPSSYSPYGSNPEYAQTRRLHVVDEMLKAGFINSSKAEELKNISVIIQNDRLNIVAPHFVFYLKDFLLQKYGLTDFYRQGLTVTTTLDLPSQFFAEKVVKEEVDKVNKLRISNGAALIVGVKDGDILAMVGSKDYFATDIDGKFNVTTALRQPGSSIKPINYALALSRDKTLATIIDDSPVTYPIPNQKPYSPQNYNGKYMGQVTLRTALASSLNIPSVKLLQENGVENMINLAESMGITTWQDRSRFGLSLALGGGDIKMVELAGAYTIFANYGQKIDLNPILKIENYLGETIIRKHPQAEALIDPKIAFLINHTLSDDSARAPIFGLNSRLKIPNHTVAVKTGTTNSLKDNWCLGWDQDYLVAVWVGNNDSSPMSWVASGISGATPIWQRLMKEMVKDKVDRPWPIPSGIIKTKVCDRDEYFISGTEKNLSCPTITPTPSPT